MPTKDRPILVCARHGTTALNSTHAGESAERIRSWANVPLTPQGTKEAHELAEKLGAEGFPFESIWSSDLSRAVETAECVGDKIGLPVEKTTALRPWGLGYLTKQLVKDAIPVMEYFVNHETKEVPGGESFAQFRMRALSFVQKMAHEALTDNKTILLVTHTRDLQLIKAFLANGAPNDLSINRAVFDDYSKEISPSGFLEVEPNEALGPEWKAKHGSVTDSEDEDGT
jgi:alpha-ribazole phosphatase